MPGKLGLRSDSQKGISCSEKFQHFYQFRSKLEIIPRPDQKVLIPYLLLSITHTIDIKWKEKYDAVVVDCHHNSRLCGDRMKMSVP